MDRELFQGMTREMLLEAWGEPDDREEQLARSTIKQTSKYNQVGVTTTGIEFILENDIVVGWKST
jgi:hypothetical protein